MRQTSGQVSTQEGHAINHRKYWGPLVMQTFRIYCPAQTCLEWDFVGPNNYRLLLSRTYPSHPYSTSMVLIWEGSRGKISRWGLLQLSDRRGQRTSYHRQDSWHNRKSSGPNVSHVNIEKPALRITEKFYPKLHSHYRHNCIKVTFHF